MFFISKCCRLCLSKNNTLVNIIRRSPDKISYLSKLLLIAPTLISNPHNYLMAWICEKCRQKLSEAYNFVQQCLETDALLEKYSSQLVSCNSAPHEYKLEVPVSILTEIKIKEFIQKPINEECRVENVSQIEDNQNNFESLFTIDKQEFPLVNLEIKLEPNDPLTSADITSFESFENEPNASIDEKIPKNEMSLVECNLNQHETVPVQEFAKTNCRNSSSEADGDDLNDTHLKTDAAGDKQKERPFKCIVCKKSFARKYAADVHLRIHTGERPYKCDVCQKRFTALGHLITHKRIHSGEFPYKCDICQKGFKASGDLNRHRRIHSGERPYECDICQKRFNVLGSMIRHKKKHSVERSMNICDICQKVFKHSGHFIKHKKIHNSERLYEWDI